MLMCRSFKGLQRQCLITNNVDEKDGIMLTSDIKAINSKINSLDEKCEKNNLILQNDA